MLRIGPYTLQSNVVLAPMAGVSDAPFRALCKQFGAGMVTSEMSSSNPALINTRKSILRQANTTEAEPRAVQIVGTEARQMADFAQFQQSKGAQIVDINMGCPAKKVCNKLAGSALLKDERLVADILSTVVESVDIPVTLKIRTGWDQTHRNALSIAKIAEDCGIQSLAVHGRTRACKYKGDAEYDTIAAIAQQASIPIFANGDITSAEKAKYVLDYTGADGIMIGRGAQGKPWIFKEINDLLDNRPQTADYDINNFLGLNSTKTIQWTIMAHITAIHNFYALIDKSLAVKIARKHMNYYFAEISSVINTLAKYKKEDNLHRVTKTSLLFNAIKHVTYNVGYNNNKQGTMQEIKQTFNQLSSCNAQIDFIQLFLETFKQQGKLQHEH